MPRSSATRIAVALLVVTLACACVQTCTEPSALPSTDSFAGPCGEDHDCVAVPSKACGHDCDCDVVIAADEQDRYEREVLNVELCCTEDQASAICDCADATPACEGGRCVSASR